MYTSRTAPCTPQRRPSILRKNECPLGVAAGREGATKAFSPTRPQEEEASRPKAGEARGTKRLSLRGLSLSLSPFLCVPVYVCVASRRGRGLSEGRQGEESSLLSSCRRRPTQVVLSLSPETFHRGLFSPSPLPGLTPCFAISL